MRVDGRFVTAVVLIGIAAAPLDRVATTLAQYDHLVFKLVLALFVVVSAIGTRVVLMCGELPANDELFNMRELTTTQRAALRGEHVGAAAAAAG